MTEPFIDTELPCSQVYSTQKESGRFVHRAADGTRTTVYFTDNGSGLALVAGETPFARARESPVESPGYAYSTFPLASVLMSQTSS